MNSTVRRKTVLAEEDTPNETSSLISPQRIYLTCSLEEDFHLVSIYVIVQLGTDTHPLCTNIFPDVAFLFHISSCVIMVRNKKLSSDLNTGI